MVLTLSEAVLLVQSSVLVLIAENIPILEQGTVMLCDGCYFHGRLSCLDGAQIFLVWEAYKKLVSSCNGFRFFTRSLSLKQVCCNTYSTTRSGEDGEIPFISADVSVQAAS